MNKLARRLIAITAGAVTGTVLYHMTKNRRAVPADPTALKNSGTRTIETERLILRRFRIEEPCIRTGPATRRSRNSSPGLPTWMWT